MLKTLIAFFYDVRESLAETKYGFRLYILLAFYWCIACTKCHLLFVHF